MRETSHLTRRAVAAALPLAALAGAGTIATHAAAADPVLAQIELHKALVIRVNRDFPGDEGPAFQAACAAEEAAIQALGDMMPTTVAGAAAQLQYMADVEAEDYRRERRHTSAWCVQRLPLIGAART